MSPFVTQKTELLAPAGSMAALSAAIRNGADAVYFGGSYFNARINADNFGEAELREAIALCASSNVRSYITLNTLLFDKELGDALDFVSFLYEAGASALIVQDIGLTTLLRKHFPLFELHASTQMGIHSIDGAKLCSELGLSRVVLSRELALDEIRNISLNTDIELECFVHGALCMSFSGGCLFSSMAGGRSGNRGTCAQPCRKIAAIDRMPTAKDYELSLSDLCMIDHTKELAEAGIKSLKIEGRMKKPEYVASVTHAYRRALDGADERELAELKAEIHSVFARGESSVGYYFPRSSSEAKVGSIAKATPTKELLSRINGRESLQKLRTINMQLSLKAGFAATLDASVCDACVTSVGAIAESSRQPVTDETLARYREQLAKLGGTPFAAGSITVSADDAFLPVSEVNALRRDAVSKLAEALSPQREPVLPPDNCSILTSASPCGTAIIAKVISSEQLCGALSADIIVLEFGFFTSEEAISVKKHLNGNQKLLLALPPAIMSSADMRRAKEMLDCEAFDGLEINNLGQFRLAKKSGYVLCGLGMNVTNSASAASLLNLGADCVTLSQELGSAMLRDIIAAVPKGRVSVCVYARAVMMNLFHCPLRETRGCAECKAGKSHYIYDESGRRFPLLGMKYNCFMTRLLNCLPTDIIEAARERIAGYSPMLCFYDEGAKRVAERIEAAKNAAAGKPQATLENTTRGYFTGSKKC